MGMWQKIEFQGRTYGQLWEAGTRKGKERIEFNRDKPGGRSRWHFPHKKIGKKAIRVLKKAPRGLKETETAWSIVRQWRAQKKLSDKQWVYLGALLTRIDPSCSEHPTIRTKKREEVEPQKPMNKGGRAFILRKRNS